MSIDKEYGGLVYEYSPDGNFTNDNKYFWVQAEALAASWRLYKITNKKDNNKYPPWRTKKIDRGKIAIDVKILFCKLLIFYQNFFLSF